MEIKATLNKPYTDKQRADFVVENNHTKGYEIKETETALEAWGLTQEEQEQTEEKFVKEARIAELKQYLADTDYCILKIEEAVDEAEKQDLREKYKDIIKARRKARIEINNLEN
jgi:hypothetical protein